MLSVLPAAPNDDGGAGVGHTVLTNQPEQLPGRTIQKDLEIQQYTDPGHNPMIPHTPVLKPGAGDWRIERSRRGPCRGELSPGA